MLFLNENLFINKGTNRVCYEHPHEKIKCLKIDLTKNKETKRELKYYKILSKNNISFDMLSRYYGSVETNLGIAESFELIRNFDGSIAIELDKYLNNLNISDNEIEEIIKCIPSLKQYLYKNRIYVKDLNTVNIVYKRNKLNSKLVIIDGLAHSNYNPFLYQSDYFILKKIDKSWEKFVNSIKRKELIKSNPFFKNYLH